MKSYKFRINGNQYEAEVLETDGNMVKIEVNGTVYEVEMQRELPKKRTPATPVPSRVVTTEKPSADQATIKPTEVKAPLPGVIMQVLVRQGDEVKAAQTLCTLETMKMENAIKAEKAGKITAVNISPNQSVLQDEVLIIIS
jgi:biotin carboxyl carrier protein